MLESLILVFQPKGSIFKHFNQKFPLQYLEFSYFSIHNT